MSYDRICPDCGKTISHKDKYYRNMADKEGKLCQSCAHKGNSHTEKTKRKIAKSNKETKSSDEWEHHLKNKSYEDVYGKQRAEQIKSDISKGNSGKTVSFETRRKISEAQRGQSNPMHGKSLEKTEEHKDKIRASWVKTMGDRISPKHNPEACEFIEHFAEKHAYNFQHAENGGEFCIEELGYFVDGYDKEKNVVIEYYESWHQRTKHKKRDKRRREKIMKHTGCKFIEYHEWSDSVKVYEKL